jgi:hypothetical protein
MTFPLKCKDWPILGKNSRNIECECKMVYLMMAINGRNMLLSKKMIGEPWFPGLRLKTVLKWDFYWNKCTLYIKIQTLLKHYYKYSTLFIEITQSVLFVVTSVS